MEPSDDDFSGAIPMHLVKGAWAKVRQKMLLARLPKAAQPQAELPELAKSYTLVNPMRATRIQVVLSKPIWYVKGATKERIDELGKTFGTKIKIDKFMGASIPLASDPYGSYATAMAVASWTLDDFEPK